LENDEERGHCRNPTCPVQYVLAAEVHASGYCTSCCALMGPLGCEDCEWDDDLEDD
jgi:hypothetical protein